MSNGCNQIHICRVKKTHYLLYAIHCCGDTGRKHEIAICPQQSIYACDLFIYVLCGYAQMCVRAHNVCTYRECYIHVHVLNVK